MSERLKEFIIAHRIKAVAVLSVAGALAVGPKIFTTIDNEFFHSDIVAGVPVQVEARRSAVECEYRVGISGACVESVSYYLQVEQCQQDISAVRKGKRTQSFDLRAGKIGKGCLQDEVRVSLDVWRGTKEANIVILPGTPFSKIVN